MGNTAGEKLRAAVASVAREVWGQFRKSSRNNQSSRWTKPLLFEPLESRVYMNADVKLAGSPFGTNPGYQLHQAFEKATDGSTSTIFFYHEANGGYAGIDLGDGEQQTISKIRYYAYPGLESSMVGGKFQGAGSINGTYTDLATISSTPATGWNTFTLSGGTGYRYLRYLGPNGNNSGIAEMEFYASVPASAPAAPTNLQATALASDRIRLNWTDASSNETGFRIQRKTGLFGTWTTLTDVGANATTYTDASTDLRVGHPYSYRIRSLDAAGDWTYSAEVSTSTLGSVTKLSGSAFGTSPGFVAGQEYDKASDGDINTKFFYRDPSGGYSGIDLGSGNAKQVTKIRFHPVFSLTLNQYNTAAMLGGRFEGANSQSGPYMTLYTISSMPSGDWNDAYITDTNTYRFLRYVGPDGSWSGIAEMEFYTPVMPAAPAMPTSVAASASSTGASIHLSWTYSANSTAQTGFRIERKTGVPGAWATLATAAANDRAYDDSNVVLGRQYFYRLVATSASQGESNFSDSADATTAENVKLTGSPIGTSPGFQTHQGFEKATDGDTSTVFFYLQSNGGWTGIDLGQSRQQVVSKVRFFPVNTLESSLVGGVFEGSNSPTSGYVTLYTVTSTPQAGWNEACVDNTNAYRYLRYRGPNGSNSGVADVEFDSAVPANAQLKPHDLGATPISGTQISLAWSYDGSTSSTGGFVVERRVGQFGTWSALATLSSSARSYTNTGLRIGRQYAYRVRSLNPAGSADWWTYSNEASATPLGGLSQLTGTVFGTTPGFTPTQGPEKAFDGDPATPFFYQQLSGGYTGIDLGAGHAKSVAAIRFHPVMNTTLNQYNPEYMVGGKFQGSNTSSTSGFVDLYTVTSMPTGGWNEAYVDDTTAYRYLRYIGPDNTWSGVGEIEFYVANPAFTPTISTAPNSNSTEGAAYTIQLSATGAAASDIVSWTVDWGDGTDPITYSGTPSSVQHVYDDDNDNDAPYTITATATDGVHMPVSSNSLSVAIHGIAPTPSISGLPSGGIAGQVFPLTASATDPSATDTTTGFTYAWTVTKDGADYATGSGASYSFTPNDSGSYVISLAATDKDGATGTTSSSAIPVTISVQSPSTTVSGSTYSVNLSAANVGGKTVNTWNVDWGDGQNSSVSGTTTQVSHTYAVSMAGLVIQATASDAGGSALATFTLPNDARLSGVGSTIPGTSASIIVLNSTARGALTVNGEGQLIVGGSVVVDSSDSQALTAVGNALLEASEFDVHGGIKQTGNAALQGTVHTGSNVVSDPLSGLTAPAPGSSHSAVKLTGGTLTISPGAYPSISVSGTGTLIMNPGVYTIQGGGFDVSGQGSVSGAGVCIVNTSDAKGKTGSVSFSGQGNISITAPSSGTLTHIVVFQPAANTKTLSVSGKGVVGIGGTIYAPGAMVSVTGNGQMTESICADQVRLSGNGQIINGSIVTLIGHDFTAYEGTPSGNVAVASFTGVLTGGFASDTVATINWGDGHASPATIVANGSGGYDVVGSNTYDEEGVYSTKVSVNIVIQGLVNTTVNCTATVNEVPVAVTGGQSVLATAGVVFADQPLATFVDPPGAETLDEYAATIDWGDGSADSNGTIVFDDQTESFTVLGGHSYSTNGTYTVTVAVVHGGLTSSATSTVTAQASASISGASSVNEGNTYTLSLSGSSGVLSWSINWGDGSDAQIVQGNPPSVTHTFADGPHSYTITAAAVGSSWIQAAGSVNVTVNNVAPTASLTADTPAPEGAAGTMRFNSPADPSSADVNAGLKFSYDFNNDGVFEITDSASSTASIPASYLADGPGSRTVHGRIKDKDGAFNDYTASITISNVAPTLTLSGSSLAVIGQTYTLGLASSDPGTDTIQHWFVNWGDGSDPDNDQQVGQIVTGNSTSVTHTFAAGGSYTISATATDEDGTYDASNVINVNVNSGLDLMITCDGFPTGWTTRQSGGSGGGIGSVVHGDNKLTLNEGNSFDVEAERALTITQGLQHLVFTYEDFSASAQPGRIRDAFEVALVDANGNPLVSTFASSRDAFFNDTEQLAGGANLPLASGSGVTLSNVTADGGTVSLDVSGISAGTAARLIFRLVNNDGDTDTTVSLQCNDETEQPFTSSASIDPDIDEGSVAHLTGLFTGAAPGDDVTLSVNWGDGTSTQTIPAGTGSFDATHRWADDNPTTTASDDYTVTYTLSDGHGHTIGDSLSTTVHNVLPTVAGQNQFVFDNSNEPLNVATFSDPGFGSSETFSATIDWGDGSALAIGTVSTTAGSAGIPTTGAVSGSHSFSSPGVYTGTVKVYDDDSGQMFGTATFAVQVENEEIHHRIFRVPGDPGTNTTVRFNWTERDAGFNNELGIFVVDDVTGRVGTKRPTDSNIATNGYWKDALTRTINGNQPGHYVVFASNQTVGASVPITLPAGTLFSTYMVQNSTTADALNNSASALPSNPRIWFAFDQLNNDHTRHMERTDLADGRTQYQVEDQTDLGDSDFDDMVFTIAIDGTSPSHAGNKKFFVIDKKSSDNNSTNAVVYAYDDGGALDGQSSYTVTGTSSGTPANPRGIVAKSNGSRVWSVDAATHLIYLQDGAGGVLGRFKANDSGIGTLEGIATDEANLWLLDNAASGTDKIRKYNSRAADTNFNNNTNPTNRTQDSSFNLDAANSNPTDLVTDNGSLFWIVNDAPSGQADKVFIYNSSGVLQGSWTLDASNSDPSGITLSPGTSGTDLWVLDRADKLIYHYANARGLRSGSATAADTIKLGVGNSSPEGIADPVFLGSIPPVGTRTFNNLSDFIDVTSDFSFLFGRTSYRDSNGVLFAGVTPTHIAHPTVQLRGRVLLAVTNIDDPEVSLSNASGFLADGTPYIDITHQFERDDQGFLTPLSSLSSELAFQDAVRRHFNFDLRVLTVENQAPYFTSNPYSGDQGQAFRAQSAATGNDFLELVAGNENALRYTLAGADPDGDAVTYSIVTGPAGMTIEDVNGAPTLLWEPGANDVGLHSIRLRVTDEHGLFDPAADQLISIHVVTGVPNRSPHFTTSPLVIAYAGESYSYDADAADPDGDTLAFSYLPDADATKRPGGNFAVNSSNGVVSWLPAYADIGKTYTVRLRVSDQQSPALYEDQEYQIEVRRSPDPHIPGTPDLTVADVDGDGVTHDPQRLRATGVITADVSDIGAGSVNDPFDVLFFEDLDFNQQYTAGVDNVLGKTHVDQPLMPTEHINVAGAIDGAVQFAGGHIWAFVDSGGAITESNETNNTDRTERDCKVTPVVGQFNPVVEWSHQVFTINPASDQCMAAPAVADINEDGTPDVIIVTFSLSGGGNMLRALDGSDGHELWGVSSNLLQTENSVTVGDIDGDGHLEILASIGPFHLRAFENDGTVKWTSPSLGNFSGPSTVGWGASSLVDLDGDGDVEVVIGKAVLDGMTGAIVWTGSPDGTGFGTHGFGVGPLSIVADLDMDGSPEVVAGNSAYHADGSLYWNATGNGIGDGFTAVGNFNDDPFPEVALVHNGRLFLLDHTGALIWGTNFIPGIGIGGAPTIADVDGDGKPEIGVAGTTAYTVFETDGTIKWQTTTSDVSSGMTGSTVFDFEGDGKAEIVYADEHFLRIYRGTDGAVLYVLPMGSNTAYELPVVADVDGDGNAEVVVVANQLSGEPRHGVFVIGDLNDTWIPTRQIWNQHSYHVTNVNDDGSIPQHEQPSWLASNTYRLNTIPDPDFSATDAPDLIPSYIRVNDTVAGQATYTVRVGNNGNFFAPAGVAVAFYDGDPNAGGTLLGTQMTSARLDEGHFEDVALTVNAAAVADLWVVADDNNRVRECDEDNNSYSLMQGTAPITPNAAPVINSTPVTSVFDGENYLYKVLATDANNHALMFDLVTKPQGMTIDPVTGEITWQPRASDVGIHSVLIRVRDGHGGSDLQQYDLNVLSTNTAPTIDSLPNKTAALNKEYRYQLHATDPNGDALSWSIGPALEDLGMSIDASTGLLTWTPQGVGQITVAVAVSDGRGGFDTQEFVLEVTDQNTAPSIDSAPEGPIFVGEQWEYQLLVHDAEDGDNIPANSNLRFSLDDAAAQLGMSIDSTGKITWTPAAAGVFSVKVMVQDSGGITVGQQLTWPVEHRPAVNRPADIYSEATGPALVGQPWQYLVKAKDLDGDPITMDVTKFVDADGQDITDYTVTQVRSGQMLIEWTPPADTAGPVHIEVAAADNHNAGETQAFDLPVLLELPPDHPPTIASTPPTPGIGGQTYVYVVRGSDPDNDTITFSLQGSDHSGLSITRLDSTSARIQWDNPPASAQRDFTIRAEDGRGGWCEQRIVLQIGSGTGSGTADTPPTISSEPTFVVVAGQAYRYQVLASDPDASVAHPITYAIDAPSRPGLEAAIDSSTGLINWATSNSDIGEWNVTVRATQAGATAYQTFRILVTDPTAANSPPLIQPPAGPTKVVAGADVSFRVVATDPDNDALTYRLVDSNGGLVTSLDGLTIDAFGVVRWSTPSDASNRSITVRVSDTSGAYDEQSYNLTVVADADPSVSLSATVDSPTAGSDIGFLVTAHDDVGIVSKTVTITASWLSQPLVLNVGSDGVAHYQIPSTVAGLSFIVKATARDTAGHLVNSTNLSITVAAAGTAAPVVILNGVGNGMIIDQATDLTGEISDPDGDLVYYAITATPDIGGAPILIAKDGVLNGSLHLDDVVGLLATINPQTLPNGSYTFTVYAQDATRRERSSSFTGEIKSQTKIGNFSLSFDDLTTTVGGVPITVTRTYDSSRADQNGDFGYGWNLGITKGSLQVDVPAGEDPLIGGGWQQAYKSGTRITITLPDGTTRGFTTVLISDYSSFLGGSAILGLDNLFLVAFLPDVDSRDTKLDFTGGQSKPLIVPEESGLPRDLGLPGVLTNHGFNTTTVHYNDETGELGEPGFGGGLPFNPATYGWNFRVEQVDGTVYRYDSSDGHLIDITDRTGNQVTFNDGGDTIEAKNNAGQSLAKVEILRDTTTSRVDQIRWNDNDPTTNDVLNYTYDPVTGDLKTFTNRAGGVTQYTYDREFQKDGSGNWVDVGPLGRPHFLTRITDVARGVNPLTATFDSSGRLDRLVDASGAAAHIGYTLNGPSVGLPAGQTVQVTSDALDATSETVRDVRGNVVRQIQQTGTDKYLVTVYTFDALDHQTSATRPIEVSASQRFTWQPSSNADYASRTTYGDSEHPDLATSETDALGNTTTYTYDGRGNPLTITDGLGKLTTNQYDGNGQLTTTTDGNGNVTTYGYDPHGNLTAVTQTTADGSPSTVATNHFNVVDLMDTTTDATGRTISLEYDGRGREKAMSWVGGDGKVVRQEKIYDDEGRITGIHIFVDGHDIGSNDMNLTASGKVITSTDPFGRVTTMRYDARDQVVETRTPAKDENGNNATIIIRTAFDVNGREVARTDPFIEGITPTSDLRVTHTLYDSAGRVIETRRLKGIGIGLTYVSGGTGADHLGGIFSSSFTYDATTDRYGSTPAANAVLSKSQTNYDSHGRMDSTVSETGLVTHFEYDEADRQKKTWFDLDLDRDIDGNSTTDHHETTFEYDAAGRQTRTTDAAGRVTDTVYDAIGQVIRQINRGYVAPGVAPGSGADNTTDDVVMASVYDELGRKKADVDPLGRRTDYDYDSAGRLVAVTLPAVDMDGRATGVTDARRPRYEYHYDSNGNQSCIVSNIYLDATGTKVVYVTKSGTGAATEFQRAFGGDPSTWPVDKGNVTAFTYDNNGRMLTRTLPVGTQTSGNPNDLVERKIYETAAGPSEGQLKYQVDFSGRVTAFDYDNTSTGGGRVKGVRYYNTLSAYQADTSSTAAVRKISYRYDALGRQVEANDSAFSAVTHYAYDADGRLTKIESPQGTLHYAYDSLGRKIATWTGSGESLTEARTQATTLTEYEYDQLNRLVGTTSVRRFGQNVDVNSTQSGVQPERTRTVFATNGQIDYELTSTAGDDLVTDRGYDDQGRVTSIRHFDDNNGNHVFDTGDVLLSGFQYTYFADGSRKSETSTDEHGHVTTKNWSYDGENRLAKETFDGFDGSDAALNYTDTFQYDFDSNRTQVTHDDRTSGGLGSAGPDSVTTSLYDANDRLISETKDVAGTTTGDTYTAYTYDNADQTGKTVHQGLTAAGTVSEQTTFSYDVTGKMTGASVTSGGTTTSVSYAYDSNGFRVERTEGGFRTIYHIDPTNPTGYSQVIEEGNDSNNNHTLDAGEVQKAYTLGIDVLTQATATQVLHLLSDALGSTRAVLNPATGPVAAGIAQRYAYSAYGEDLGVTMPLTAIRYAGEMIDPVTGLSFNRARWYDPAIGRFLRIDQDAGSYDNPLSLAKYLYGNANPVNATDPSGMTNLLELVAVMGKQVGAKLERLYNAGKTSGTMTKVLVQLAFVYMYALSFKIKKLEGLPRYFMALDYFAYELPMFYKRYAGKVKTLRLAPRMWAVAAYVARLPGDVAKLSKVPNDDPLTWDFLTNKGDVKDIVFIPLTGSYEADRWLSTGAKYGAVLRPLVMDLVNSAVTGDWAGNAQKIGEDFVTAAGKVGVEVTKGGGLFGMTWHHNEIFGVMESVDTELHKTKHTGGVFFWELIHGEEYRGFTDG